MPWEEDPGCAKSAAEPPGVTVILPVGSLPASRMRTVRLLHPQACTVMLFSTTGSHGSRPGDRQDVAGAASSYVSWEVPDHLVY